MKLLLRGLACLLLASRLAQAGCDDLPTLDSAHLQQLGAAHHLPGAYVAIVSTDAVCQRWHIGALTAQPGRPDTPRIRLGSITKTFNALAVAREVTAGRLRLSTPCPPTAPYCPRDSGDRPGAASTIAELLEHTSGMADLAAEEFAVARPLTPAAAFALAPTSRHRRWPRARFAVYSNNNAAALGALLAARADRGYETVLQQTVLGPLGLRSASFAAGPWEGIEIPAGYAEDGASPLPYWHMIHPSMGGLNIAAGDMLRVVQLFVARGRQRGREFLPPAMIARMETPRTALSARAGLAYGYGLGIYPWYRRGVRFLGHDGDADGHLAQFGYAPSRGLGYLVAINSASRPGLRALRRAVELAIVGDGAPVPPRVPVSVADRRALCGTWRSLTARFPPRGERLSTLQIKFDGDRLLDCVDGRTCRELIPVRRDRFRRDGEGEATIVHVVQDGASLLLGDDLGNFVRETAAGCGG